MGDRHIRLSIVTSEDGTRCDQACPHLSDDWCMIADGYVGWHRHHECIDAELAAQANYAEGGSVHTLPLRSVR